MRRTILGKLTNKIQRAVHKRRESWWTTVDLLQSLQDYFATEDEIQHAKGFTPHKDTTKLRVVFDRSAHQKDVSCLNDKLYHGPVIVPSLIDILNRFRIGKVAITSDIEKAFLQVHHQRINHEETRRLWIRNINQPLRKANMVTYRSLA
ncbi:unnamed protein product [Heligmosomoides polygyrus]|uniref:Reverse transcriptase domain-containing protein n=1 Tax=Heligmosomoides polygyrus TaxID=6339 RepID=A0A183GGH5_HELPZ|nr:unnamed protein product [Heligmosomoides polygyrus]